MGLSAVDVDDYTGQLGIDPMGVRGFEQFSGVLDLDQPVANSNLPAANDRNPHADAVSAAADEMSAVMNNADLSSGSTAANRKSFPITQT
jgi:hypothetical protein